jgi:hypothetical protein
MNKIWQPLKSESAARCLMTNGRPLTVLPHNMAFCKLSPNGSVPITPMVMGAMAFENAAAGQSTYLAKLKRKSALT